jgi:hypothetical protein
MPELQKLYEIILNKKLNRGNFLRKCRYDICRFTRVEKAAHKAPLVSF